MKTGGGDFSADAYQQLREAYDKEQQRQVDDELAGTKLMGQEYGLETAPVDSPWADKIDRWEYPDGRSQYMDGKQSPEEILEIMRQSAVERIEAKKEEEDPDGLDEMSDEEFDAHIDKVLSDAEANEADEEDEDEVEEEESEEDVEEEAEESESDDDDAEEDEAEAEDESEEEAEETVEQDAEDIAAEIAALKAELEAMSFVPESQEEEETTEE